MHLIALDLDGTLEDSRADMVAAARRVRAGFGLPARADSALLPFVNGGMDALYRACFDDYLGSAPQQARIRAVREAYEADYLEHVAVATRLYTGIEPALVKLAELGALACVTNKPERISRRLLEALGVGALFRAVIGGDSCVRAKPDKIMLEAAAERCGFDRTRGTAFMIGDTDADIRLGRAYGAHSVWCAWGYVAAPAEVPDRVAREPAELPELVRLQGY